MLCPECKKDNPEHRKFCRECGKKLILLCPQCSTENIPGDKFCGECGNKLAIASEALPRKFSLEDKLDKIQKYLPKGLTEKILAQRDKIEGERKQVTVLFCDMEGFTILVEKIGPEEAYTLMDQVYEILIHKVHDYEGTVNEMTGDGIMALFGAPIALEEAPQRAIRSAYAIHREMTKFSEKIKLEKDLPPIKMRLGIHTGPVVVGTLGNDLRVEFKAVGDTVNLASRMEGLADPGTTFVTEETFKLTKGFFRFESLGAKEIKGKAESVKVYRVIGPSGRRTRFDVSAESGLTPLVGRQNELALLLDGFNRVRNGQGQAFSIVSEAGFGKSRLLYEVRKAVSNEDMTFLEGKCLSYSSPIAYHAIIDVLKSNFEIQHGDTTSDIRKKVTKGLNILDSDNSETTPYILDLLSIPDSGINEFALSPESKKVRVIDALKRIVIKGAEFHPLIIAIEDLHWIDNNSIDALKELMNSISGAPVLLIFTYRPVFAPDFSMKSYFHQINLNRLTEQQSVTMVSNVLSNYSFDHYLETLITDKTEGNPFFIEEFIKSLKDLKLIKRKADKFYLAKDIQGVSVPSSIQDVIMARVDSLPENARDVLQKGSTIEREFDYKLIKYVTGLSEKELLRHLMVLKDSELIYERGIFPNSTYVFKHALTREVVYNSILVQKQKELHGRIGNCIEELYKENIGEYFGILAEHYIQADNYSKGAEYSKLAGKKAKKAASYKDAIEHARKRVTCIERLPQTDDSERALIDARTALGLYYMHLNLHYEANESVKPILDMALKHRSKSRLSQIFCIIGSYKYMIEESILSGLEKLEEGLKIAEEENDLFSSSQATFFLGCGRSLNAEFEMSLNQLSKTLNLGLMVNNSWSIALTKSMISYFPYFMHGNIDKAYTIGAEAIQASKQSGDNHSMGVAHVCYGVSCFGKGFLDEGLIHLSKGVELCEKTHHFSWLGVAHQNLGEIHFQNGEFVKSKEHFENAVTLLEKNRYLPSWKHLNDLGIAKVKVKSNKKGFNLDQLIEYEYQNRVKIFDGWMARYIAEVLMNLDIKFLEEAKDWIEKAIKADKRYSMMFHLGIDYTIYAELLKHKGDHIYAKKKLSTAIKILKECGADGWVNKFEKDLAALS